MVTILQLINLIDTYKIDTSKKIREVKIVLGEEGYSGVCWDEDYCINHSSIDIYKEFKEVAFIMNDLSYKCSELFVLGLILGDNKLAIEFLDGLRKIKDGFYKFIEYIYYEHGIVFINRVEKKKCFELFDKNGYKVTDVMIIGSKPYLSCINKMKSSVPATGKLIHCSSYNLGSDPEDYAKTWITHDDNRIKKISNHSKTSFNKFIII